MSNTIDTWIHQAEQKIASGTAISRKDLQELRTLRKGEQQHLLYIWGADDRVDSAAISWNYFGPFDSEYRFDPKNELPRGKPRGIELVSPMSAASGGVSDPKG